MGARRDFVPRGRRQMAPGRHFPRETGVISAHWQMERRWCPPSSAATSVDSHILLIFGPFFTFFSRKPTPSGQKSLFGVGKTGGNPAGSGKTREKPTPNAKKKLLE